MAFNGLRFSLSYLNPEGMTGLHNQTFTKKRQSSTKSDKVITSTDLTLLVPIPQNGQTH